ncbi:MAG: UDP-N-acetylmuramate--L-alanine ligase, partial [Chitinophagales bacterium]
SVYFIGIGGIGMSALARYFHRRGAKVSGYDKTATPLTDQLQAEGMVIRFEEDVEAIPKEVDVVVFTPAIPNNHLELNYYRDHDYPVLKRSQILGLITKDTFTIAVAGSHGKTTVTSMIAHILEQAGYGCTAFVGGIMVNYNSNYLSGRTDVIVVEADEYDRSFLNLHPNVAVITAVDTDHLDIYGTQAGVEEAFTLFVRQMKENGLLVAKEGIPILPNLEVNGRILTYDLQSETADFHIRQRSILGGAYIFELESPAKRYAQLALNIGGLHNVENSIAAIAVAESLGIEGQAIAEALATFKGIKRRFEYIIEPLPKYPESSLKEEEIEVKKNGVVMIDDYAHHPEELRALLTSVRDLYADKKITAIFQPHLFSRTKDLAEGFGKSLNLADEVVLLDIYPAREKPIEGVTSKLIFDEVTIEEKTMCPKSELLAWIEGRDFEVLLTVGAGDISGLVLPIRDLLTGIGDS